MSFAVALSIFALAGAAVPEPPKGWVRPDRADLATVLGIRWTAQLAEPAFLINNPEQWTSPLITQDHARVIVGTTAGTLEARSVASGEVLWRKHGLGSIGAAMSEHRGRILLSTGSNLVALDDQTGDERWRLDIAGGIGGRIVHTGTVAIIPVRSNAYVAVDVTKGELVWRVRRPTPDGITMRGQAAAVIDPATDRAFLAFSDGAVQAVTLSKGDAVWTAQIAKVNESFADIDAEPIFDDAKQSIVVASYAAGLYKLDTSNGRTIWKKEELTRLTGMVRAGVEGVIVGAHGDGQVMGISPSNGTVRWRYRFKRGSPIDPLYLGHGFVLIGNTRGPLSLLDVTTGRPIQLIAPGAAGISSVPSWRDPDLAILSNRGLLLMLRFGGGAGISF